MNQILHEPIWADEQHEPLESLQGDIETDVCVVGLGGSGLAAVDTALRLNQRVVGIDAGRVANAAAGSNGGFLMAGLAKFYHETAKLLGRERNAAIYRLTLEEMDRMESETPAAIRRNGTLRIASCQEEVRDCMKHFLALHNDGFEAEPYEENHETRGIFVPTDGVFHPQQRCREMAKRVMAGGALLFENTPAKMLSDGLVGTGKGRIWCKNTIVAVDGALESMFRDLHGKVRTARLQMLSTKPEAHRKFPLPMYARWGYDYLQQLPDGRIAMGGCRDLHEAEEWTTSKEPTEAVQQSIERMLRTYGVTAPVERRWAANVGYTKSGVPIAQEVLRPNIWAFGGYNGTGNVPGSLLGRAVARQVITKEPGNVPLLTAPPK